MTITGSVIVSQWLSLRPAAGGFGEALAGPGLVAAAMRLPAALKRGRDVHKQMLGRYAHTMQRPFVRCSVRAVCAS
jgi:hypothetical protein